MFAQMIRLTAGDSNNCLFVFKAEREWEKEREGKNEWERERECLCVFERERESIIYVETRNSYEIDRYKLR